MRLVPFPFHSALSQSDLPAYECSDRIVVPKSLYYLYSFPTSVLRLANTAGETVGGCLHGFHAVDEVSLYVPSWMFAMFTDPTVFVVSLPSVPCETIQVLPPSDDFFRGEGAIAAFNRALLGYKSLTQHTRILVLVGSVPQWVRIELLHPATPDTVVIHNVGNVSLSILSNKKESPGYSLLTKAANYIPFSGRGRVVKAGITATAAAEDAAACRDRMREAALKRQGTQATPAAGAPTTRAAPPPESHTRETGRAPVPPVLPRGSA
jgi:hypothetical protein